MQYGDLRDFLAALDRLGQLSRIDSEVSPRLEMTEISRRVLGRSGPALLFQRPSGHSIPVLTNLFRTTGRFPLAMGVDRPDRLLQVGELLAPLNEPESPSGRRDALTKAA